MRSINLAHKSFDPFSVEWYLNGAVATAVVIVATAVHKNSNDALHGAAMKK